MAEKAIQITSTLIVKLKHREQALQLAISHVATSRKEAGCIRHDVFVDPSEPTRFFFFERWLDRAALDQHLAQPYSLALVAQMKQWAAEPMSLAMCEIDQEHHTDPK